MPARYPDRQWSVGGGGRAKTSRKEKVKVKSEKVIRH